MTGLAIFALIFSVWSLCIFTHFHPKLLEKSRKEISRLNFNILSFSESNQWLGTWGKHMKSPMFKTLKTYQKLNHFPGTYQLGRKDRLWRNFQKMINKFGIKEWVNNIYISAYFISFSFRFGFLPHTYVLPQEMKLLKYSWENKNTGGEWFIIKPVCFNPAIVKLKINANWILACVCQRCGNQSDKQMGTAT